MKGLRRAVTTTAALAGLAATLPGCIVAVGNTTSGDTKKRIDALDERMKAAEVRLGLPTPEPVQK